MSGLEQMDAAAFFALIKDESDKLAGDEEQKKKEEYILSIRDLIKAAVQEKKRVLVLAKPLASVEELQKHYSLGFKIENQGKKKIKISW